MNANNTEFFAALDSWIDLGKTYEEAYQLATESGSANDYKEDELAVQFGIIPNVQQLEQPIFTQAEHDAMDTEAFELTVIAAKNRGYCEAEAQQVATRIYDAVRKSRATGNASHYAKAYHRYILRLSA